MKVVTGKVRFSYAHVFEPRANEFGGDPKYSVSIIIPKSDKVTLDKIEKAIKEATEQGKEKWGGKVPPKLTLPLRDGDIDRPEDDAYANSFFLNAKANQAPGVVDANLNAIIDKSEFYSGCYGRASIDLYPYATAGNKGVGVGLNHVQKLADGESLGGVKTTAENDFGSDADDLM